MRIFYSQNRNWYVLNEMIVDPFMRTLINVLHLLIRLLFSASCRAIAVFDKKCVGRRKSGLVRRTRKLVYFSVEESMT